MEESGGVGINPFGRLGAFGADQLGAEQLAGDDVAGDADFDGLGAGIIPLVVIGAGLAGVVVNMTDTDDATPARWAFAAFAVLAALGVVASRRAVRA